MITSKVTVLFNKQKKEQNKTVTARIVKQLYERNIEHQTKRNCPKTPQCLLFGSIFVCHLNLYVES